MGRVITIDLHGAVRHVAYTVSNTQPEAFVWWSVDSPHGEALSSADRIEIETACLADLRERRTDWRTQLLQRRIALELRRRRLS